MSEKTTDKRKIPEGIEIPRTFNLQSSATKPYDVKNVVKPKPSDTKNNK